MERQDTYLRYPSAQLRRQIMEEATSIAIAEQCTNARIQQTVRDFKKAINYDDTFVQTTIQHPTTTMYPTTTMTARTSVTDINTSTSPDILSCSHIATTTVMTKSRWILNITALLQ
jgi:hypothetical protein